MGLKIPPLPPDYGIGDDCLACHEAGKTPNYVFVRFWDIVTCGGYPSPPLGHVFICKQIPGFPCEYTGDVVFKGNTWRCYYDSDVPWGPERRSELSLSVRTPPRFSTFFGRELGCAAVFNNILTCVGGWGGEGGRAIVTIYINPIIIALCNQYHFTTIRGILYDFDDCGMDHQWYRICHTSDKTNIMILLDVEDVVLD